MPPLPPARATPPATAPRRPPWRGVAAALVALAVVPLPAVAATPAGGADLPAELRQRLVDGEAAFRVQDYPRVVELLQPLVGHRLLKEREEHRDVLEWLGVSHWLGGAEDAARITFTKLIQEWPRHRLDELLYPLELVRFFDARRQDMIDLGVIDPGRDPSVKTRLVLVKREREATTPTLAYFAPFGVGQFANEQPGKGTVVVALQAVGLITTAITWFALDDLKDERGFVPRADESRATALSTLWITGAALFAGGYVYSVIDGLASRPDGPDVDYRYEFIDVDDLPPAPDAAQLRLVPGPGELGVGLGGTF